MMHAHNSLGARLKTESSNEPLARYSDVLQENHHRHRMGLGATILTMLGRCFSTSPPK
jgi:hypothetical protein